MPETPHTRMGEELEGTLISRLLNQEWVLINSSLSLQTCMIR